MSLENYFNQYLDLKKTFWPEAGNINWTDAENPHPLIRLIQDSHNNVKSVALRTDHCCRLILKHNPQWLKAKSKIITSETKHQNISAALGEIRAFGELLWVWQGKVNTGNSGHDFSIESEGKNVRVEVFTPQHRTKRNKIVHKPVGSKKMRSQVIEYYPFGYPERCNKDNTQSEAISKLTAIKQEEHQFSEIDINILWCDVKDPVLWMFGFNESEFAPLWTQNENITSGSFWNAFYAKQGLPIFDNFPIGGYGRRKPYIMEYNGRFWKNTKLDFVIADSLNFQAVFQNLNTEKSIPNGLFQDLHRLYALDFQASWFDWPCPGQLKTKVQYALDTITQYANVFEQFEVESKDSNIETEKNQNDQRS
jgi:hypothetical protein